jgi:hypothetical protein
MDKMMHAARGKTFGLPHLLLVASSIIPHFPGVKARHARCFHMMKPSLFRAAAAVWAAVMFFIALADRIFTVCDLLQELRSVPWWGWVLVAVALVPILTIFFLIVQALSENDPPP